MSGKLPACRLRDAGLFADDCNEETPEFLGLLDLRQ